MKIEWKREGLIIVIAALLIIMVVVTALLGNNGKQDIYGFKKDYESYNGSSASEEYKYIDVNINTNVDFVELKESELLDTMNKKTGIFYFGFPTCPWCRNMVEPLIEVAKEEKLTIYYFNPSEIRTNNTDTYQKLIEKLSGNLEKNENNEEVLYVPDVYFIKDGKIVGHHMGTVDGQTNPYEKLSVKQHNELNDIYGKLSEQLK